MGKTFVGSHKNSRDRHRNTVSGNLRVNEGRLNDGINEEVSNDRTSRRSSRSQSTEINGKIEKTCGQRKFHIINDNTYEVWCICRLVKPCKNCGGKLTQERDSTPTPETARTVTDEVDESDGSVTPKSTGDEILNGHSDLTNGFCNGYEFSGSVNEERKYSSAANNEDGVKIRKNSKCAFGERDINEINETTGINLQELFSKLDELNSKEELNGYESHTGLNIADTPPGSPTSSMDSASICSFDHFDFDTSFCSLKSADTMEPSDLADQLSLVQQMVVEMKTGFSCAMEELSKIQYGDQTLQQQLADSKQQCNEEIVSIKTVVDELKTEVQKIGGRLQEVSDTQRSLQEKLDTYQTDKNMLLDELEQSGVINEQIRMRLTGGSVRDNNNVIPPDVAPMVHPYLNSLQNHHRGPDDYNSDSSLTAAVSRSLNLTQALGEKCLNLDFSATSSDDEDNSRNSRSGSGKRNVKRHKSFQFEESNRHSQKVPPHEQVLEQVHREEAARDIVDVEREYCSQLWSILEDYMNPLRDSEIFGRREFHLLFPSYIPHLYEQHCILLRKMEERVKKWKTNGVIGDVFAKFTESQDGDGLLLYKDFINDFPTIINSMNKWFSHSPQFREIMQSQCLANAPVLTMLLAPLQQVPKYSILLKTLLKYTPADHPDRYYLESSLGRLKQFLNSMNDDLEHAMQTININNQPVNRSRDTGNSARSKSSASSGEANHVSRDSGVHSNEEERAKSPMSPNSSRRYLLQMLREKREHGAQGHSTPRGRKSSGYGSHPDLTNQVPTLQDGRMSPFLASLPQSKMFSSLSKLPLPRENSGRSRSRPHRRQEGNRPVINPHYLRPLTPQVFPTSTSAHTFESSKRSRDEYARQRPASAMEFSYRSHDHQDEFLELLAQQASLAISPPQSTSSDRSRRDLQLSLQKLLVETGNTTGDYNDHDQDVREERLPYSKQYAGAKDRALRHDLSGEMYNDDIEAEKEDYGVYGDDDEDYENDAEFDHNVKPMQLLQDNHRPKIMVPKWRQNASPNPPSYNHGTVTHITKQTNGSTSEENLAVSLAQSLFDGNKQSTLPRDKKAKVQVQESEETATDNVPSHGSLKRKGITNRPISPVKSIPRQSPITSSVPKGKSLSFDANASRPNNLNLPVSHNVNKTDNVQTSQTSSNDDTKSVKSSSVPRPNSFTKLNDVIAYTADCLEKTDTKVTDKSDSETAEEDTDSDTKEDQAVPEKWSKKDILDNENMKVSSVDSHVPPVEQNKATHNNVENKFTFATSPTNSGTSPANADTSSVVYYFQNRDQINKGESPNHSEGQSKLPVFTNKTSTPLKEHKQFVSPTKSPTSDTFGTFTKKESGRFVRGEENGNDNKVSGNSNLNTKKASEVESDSDKKDETEGATKERVLKAVDKLRLSFERKKQLSEERRQARNEISSPTNVTIQKQFNDFASAAKTPEKPVVLRTFSSPTKQVVVNSPVGHDNMNLTSDLEIKHGLYKKSGHTKPASRYSAESSASARQIHKLERATSPTGRSTSPTPLNTSYEKFKSQVESTNIARPIKRGVSPQRSSIDGSLIPKRSKSPTRASMERERPKSTTDLGFGQTETDNYSGQQKSSTKETKIPILKKSGAPLSKSSEDISKIKKKTAFKDQIKNIFGRKKKKSKLYSYDPDEEFNRHVTLENEPSFQVDDMQMFPLTRERRSNSTSQILQSYQFEDDDVDDDVPVSSV